MCYLNRTAAEPIVASCQGLPSVKRPIPVSLLSRLIWSGRVCRTLSLILCIITSARHSARRRPATVQIIPYRHLVQMGRRVHLLADGPAGTGADRKIMLYDPVAGHRIKEPHAYVGWVHSELHLPDFCLQQCLFGEHLLNRPTSAPVMLVESEKTAVVMCHFMPDYIRLAMGGKNGSFNREAMSVLRDREVTLIPDLGQRSDGGRNLPCWPTSANGWLYPICWSVWSTTNGAAAVWT